MMYEVKMPPLDREHIEWMQWKRRKALAEKLKLRLVAAENNRRPRTQITTDLLRELIEVLS